MKTTKTNSLLRFACALLAVLTVAVSLPIFAIESNAMAATRRIEHKFDFSGGTADATVAAGGYVTSPSGFTYAQMDGKVVAKGTKGQFYISNDVPYLAGEKFSIEMRLCLTKFVAETSLIALEMKTSSTDSNAFVPLVRLADTNGVLQMRKSDGTYQNVNATIELGKWYTIKVVVNLPTEKVTSYTVDLYLDNTLITTDDPLIETDGPIPMVNIYSINRIRIMQSSKSWEGYIDSIHYRTLTDTTEYNEYISFDGFESGDTVTSDAILSTDTVSADKVLKVTSTDVKVKADPDNASNMVSYNSGNEYIMYVYEKDMRLATTSFAVSMDVRFSEFPTEKSTGADKLTALLSWVFTSSGGTTTYGTLCRVDSYGNLLDKDNEMTGKTFELNTWTNVAVLCDGTTGEYDVFFDGEYVFSADVGAPKSTDTESYIRIFNKNQGAKFSVCVDNIMLYESPRTAPATEADVIWDVDFDDLATGTRLEKTVWSGLSDVADAYNVGSSAVYTVAEFNGGKALKVTNGTNNSQIDLYMGKNEFDPLRTGGLSVKFDFAIENFDGTEPTITADKESRRPNHIVSWRRLDASGTGTAMRVLSFNYDKKFVFLGTVLDIELEAGKTYPIEITLTSRANAGYDTVTLKIGDETFSTSNNALYGENNSYFLDDAGVKHLLPYTGFIKCFLYDSEGNAVTDDDGNFVFVDKLVARKTFYTDMLRLCQGATNSTADYYIDNFKAEVVKSNTVFSTDFTGWETLTASKDDTDYQFEIGQASFVNDESNTYVKLAQSTSQKVFYGFGDKNMKLYGKDVYLETDVNFATKSEAAGSKTSFISFTEQRSLTDPFGYDSSTPSTTAYSHFLRRDELGNLYTRTGTESVGQLKYQDWTKIGIYIHGNGKKWTSYDVYLDGEYVATDTLEISSSIKTYSFRYRAINNEILFDNISVSYPEVEIEDLKMDFESLDNTNNAITKLGSGWMYGSLGSERTKILGEEGSKYLRVDHSNLTENKSAYIDMANELFIDADAYLIETSVRFTSETASTLNVAEIYRPTEKQSAPILAVRGGTNYMYVIINGVPYDLVYSDGQPIVAAQTTDSEFTKVAILVDAVNDKYTLYVNDRMAYYVYGENNELNPCADMPLYFVDKEATFTKDTVRLLEISEYKYQVCVLDVDYLNVISLGNGIGSTVKGTQTKAVSAKTSYGVRFVSGIDSLYGSEIGYEITAVYTDDNGSQTKRYDKSSSLVFEKVTSDEGDITAESLNASYLAAIEVLEIPGDTEVEFTVEPYVNHGGVKIYGESYTVKFKAGAIVE